MTNASEAGSSLLSATKLQGRITGEPAGPFSGWSMEMLTITDDRLTGNGEEDQLQKCSHIYPRTPTLCGVHPIAMKFWWQHPYRLKTTSGTANKAAEKQATSDKGDILPGSRSLVSMGNGCAASPVQRRRPTVLRERPGTNVAVRIPTVADNAADADKAEKILSQTERNKEISKLDRRAP
jgi:hypothetical protein